MKFTGKQVDNILRYSGKLNLLINRKRLRCIECDHLIRSDEGLFIKNKNRNWFDLICLKCWQKHRNKIRKLVNKIFGK